MGRRTRNYYIRRTHRYLGLILGIQFFIWTVSGLYFSWTNLDEIHGDFQHRHPPHFTGSSNFISPDSVFAQLERAPDSIHAIQFVNILGKPFYNLQFYNGSELESILADATTGAIRHPVNREEATAIAAESFNGKPEVKSVEYLAATGSHHEYRKKPLPAWAVTFDHPTSTTVYVSAEGGKVESFRNNKWRIFDFLWMGHTMDYQGRDDFNNWLLRIFSAFGLLTVISGFLLFWISRRRKKVKNLEI